MPDLTLVGCGFLGSLWAIEAAKRLRAFKMNVSFRLIDPDVVEERNCVAQWFSPSQIKRPKAKVLRAGLAPYLNQVSAAVAKLEQGNSDALIEGTALIVCAVDNVPARQLLWTEAVRLSVPLLSLGASQMGTGAVDWTWSNGEGIQVDTNPFSPIALAEETEEVLDALEKPLAQLPPCELVANRGLGLQIALAGAKAYLIRLGYDPEREVLNENHGLGGPFTCWQATRNSHTLREVHDV